MIGRDLAAEITKRLTCAGVTDAAFEAEYLIRTAAGISRAAYFAGASLDPHAVERVEQVARRRVAREPAAYITGTREFYGLDFVVEPGVLIPRPETEMLVELALAELRAGDVVVDIGTGSGCVAIAVALGFPQARVLAVDVSPGALRTALRNQERLGSSVSFTLGDLASGFSRADVVVANLPYIPTADVHELEPEVRDWEPRCALDGGPDGLTLIRRLVADCGSRLRPRMLALEVAAGQARVVQELAEGAGARANCLRDLAGIGRIVVARWA